jgi:hypothetical protein
MTKTNEQDISILDEAAAGDKTALALLIDVFDLPAGYRENLIQVLQEGAWRESNEPVEYVYRATAPRRATRRDEQGRPIEHLSQRDSNRREVVLRDETVDWLTSDLVLDTKTGAWRKGGGRAREREEALYTASESMDRVPASLRMTREARILPDWTRIAERAGLDSWETKALLCMAAGLTRYASMKALDDSQDKRCLESAWKRLKRSNFEKIKSILVSA